MLEHQAGAILVTMKAISILFASALLLSTLSACQAGPRNLPMMAAPQMLQAQASSRAVFHVVPDSKAGVWHVKAQRNPQAVSTHRTKDEAIVAGRALAKAQPLGQLIVHKANGQIETEYTYGKDPVNSVG